MAFFILTRFVLVKYSRAFVERPSQGTSSLASRLTTVSLDIWMGKLWRIDGQSPNSPVFSLANVLHIIYA